MKFFTTLPRLLVTCSLMALGLYAHATSYTCIQSGNWTDGSIWQAGVAPPATLTGNDFVIINSGLTVTMDQDETLNSSQAIVTVYGTLTSWHSMDITSGTLNGNGTIILHSLRMGTGSSWVFTGTITTDNLYNLQNQLSLQGNVVVGDTIGFVAGNIGLGQGANLTLADDAVLDIGAGTYSGYQSWHQNGRINLYYTRPGISSMGIETTFVNIHDVSVNMPSATDRLDMMGDMTVTGALSLLGGQLNMNGHNITASGTIASSGTGVLMGSSASVLNVNGSGVANSVAFAAGNNSIASLNLNLTGGGALTLSSDLTCLGTLNVLSGTLMLGSSHLTLQGAITGAGYLSAASASGLIVNGTGNMGNIKWANGGSTIGDLTINIDGTNGMVSMASDMTVAGTLALTGGYLTLNGRHLTLSGTTSAGAGAIYSDSAAYITLAGSTASGMGIIKFATGGDKVQNLEINTTNNSWATLGSPLTVSGTLMLTSGNIDLAGNDLTVQSTGGVTGGSATSYILTSGSGSLRIHIGAGSAGMLPIGTASYYAPLRVGNNAAAAGNFSALAHSGIYANGTSGSDVAASRQGVIVSWELESDMTTGANASVEAYWSQAMESAQFDRAKVFLSHYTGGTWDTYTAAAAISQPGSMWSTSRAGITSFSPFAVLSTGTATGPSGISDAAGGVAFSAYPNPARNVLTVTTPDATGTLHLHDMIGNDVGTYTVSQTTNKIDISQLASGVYVLSLNDKYSQKIVKQ
ncbi:MAG: T9SS type A sorting domain-containing protein [Bacteroidetes bacterium]|nr:T9SS type A sorting domain-containing protein [Bacteroidota bacterium]